jgi:hypothetical protein
LGEGPAPRSLGPIVGQGRPQIVRQRLRSGHRAGVQGEGEEQKEQEQKEKEKKGIPPSVADKLKEMQITEEKAKMILEAMKNQEVQYLQQNKRKATKPKEKGKPDW